MNPLLKSRWPRGLAWVTERKTDKETVVRCTIPGDTEARRDLLVQVTQKAVQGSPEDLKRSIVRSKPLLLRLRGGLPCWQVTMTHPPHDQRSQGIMLGPAFWAKEALDQAGFLGLWGGAKGRGLDDEAEEPQSSIAFDGPFQAGERALLGEAPGTILDSCAQDPIGAVPARECHIQLDLRPRERKAKVEKVKKQLLRPLHDRPRLTTLRELLGAPMRAGSARQIEIYLRGLGLLPPEDPPLLTDTPPALRYVLGMLWAALEHSPPPGYTADEINGFLQGHAERFAAELSTAEQQLQPIAVCSVDPLLRSRPAPVPSWLDEQLAEALDGTRPALAQRLQTLGAGHAPTLTDLRELILSLSGPQVVALFRDGLLARTASPSPSARTMRSAPPEAPQRAAAPDPACAKVAVYLGQTRTGSLVNELADLGMGEAVQRGELPPRRLPYFFDNGAFRDWQSGGTFDALAWTRDLWYLRREIEAGRLPPPDFIVLPDLPTQGRASLAFSATFLPGGPQAPFDAEPYPGPLYLVVQDGMEEVDLLPYLADLAGLFVGGSVEWKRANIKRWCDFAHALGLRCHVGRAGGLETLALSLAAGADSIDSSLPLWSADNLRRFRDALCPPVGALHPKPEVVEQAVQGLLKEAPPDPPPGSCGCKHKAATAAPPPPLIPEAEEAAEIPPARVGTDRSQAAGAPAPVRVARFGGGDWHAMREDGQKKGRCGTKPSYKSKATWKFGPPGQKVTCKTCLQMLVPAAGDGIGPAAVSAPRGAGDEIGPAGGSAPTFQARIAEPPAEAPLPELPIGEDPIGNYLDFLLQATPVSDPLAFGDIAVANAAARGLDPGAVRAYLARRPGALAERLAKKARTAAVAAVAFPARLPGELPGDAMMRANHAALQSLIINSSETGRHAEAKAGLAKLGLKLKNDSEIAHNLTFNQADHLKGVLEEMGVNLWMQPTALVPSWVSKEQRDRPMPEKLQELLAGAPAAPAPALAAPALAPKPVLVPLVDYELVVRPPSSLKRPERPGERLYQFYPELADALKATGWKLYPGSRGALWAEPPVALQANPEVRLKAKGPAPAAFVPYAEQVHAYYKAHPERLDPPGATGRISVEHEPRVFYAAEQDGMRASLTFYGMGFSLEWEQGDGRLRRLPRGGGHDIRVIPPTSP